MKLFGVILLSGYFLARESELFGGKENSAARLMRDWACYAACSGMAVFFGALLSDLFWLPVAVLLAAFLPALIFQARFVHAFAGAATAFCVLRAMPDFTRVALFLIAAEAGVLIILSFYRAIRIRMLRLFIPDEMRGALGALTLFFALAVFLGLAWQKAIQLY